MHTKLEQAYRGILERSDKIAALRTAQIEGWKKAMGLLDSVEITHRFVEHFKGYGYDYRPGGPLIPENDPSLLFNNAGMCQFKDHFLGLEPPLEDYCGLVTVQKCLRVGGKHNDLDEIGHSPFHHTLFHMLGNFSFGQVTKKQAIEQAWELLTKPQDKQGYGLDPERCTVSYYSGGEVGYDEETYDIWSDILPRPHKQLVGFGGDLTDNFWAMGETGLCGRSTEIFYTPENGKQVEVWNIVFMEYDRSADGALRQLDRVCIDTGLGLERLTAILLKVDSSYDTDMFSSTIDYLLIHLTNHYSEHNADCRIIVDHFRAIYWMFGRQLQPSNTRRGYVLRKIIRRMLMSFRRLGEPREMVVPILKRMLDTYPFAPLAADDGTDVLGLFHAQLLVCLEEESKTFEKILKRALREIKKYIKTGEQLDGLIGFKMYDTFGIPLEVTEEHLQDLGLLTDRDQFRKSFEFYMSGYQRNK